MNETITAPKIIKKIFIRGTITVLTGLHIGGSSVAMSIGGAEVVVRNPLTNEPYIPGSSLRGKMRALLERFRGLEQKTGEGGFSYENGKADAGKNPKTDLGKLFGVAADEKRKEQNEPTRLIVRDAHLTKDSKTALENAPNTDMPMTEVKTEVNIDRITSAANPRNFERVPAGAEFNFELVLTLLTGDDEDKFLNLVREGMELIQDDSLGGHGSRGYGLVQFTVQETKERTADNYLNRQPATPITTAIFASFTKASDPQTA